MVYAEVTSQYKLRTVAHVDALYQPLRGRFAEPVQQRKLLAQQCGGGDNINGSSPISVGGKLLDDGITMRGSWKKS